MSNSREWFEKGFDFAEKKKYEKAVEIDPKDAAAWYNMGLAYGNLKDYEKEIECYEKAVASDPKYAKAWDNMGNAYNELKKYEKAVEIDPKDAAAWNNMGFAYKNLEIYDKAINYYEEALKIDPNLSLAKNNLEEAKRKQKEKKELEEKKIIVKKTQLRKETREEIQKKEIVVSKANREESKVNQIFVGCAGIWQANSLNFKVKVKNDIKYSITDLKVILDKYPSMLELQGEIVKTTAKLSPGGALWSLEFKFFAGEDCVSGIINASVSYYDHEEQKHNVNVRPYEISYICPLLEAKRIDEENYLKKKKNMYSQEQQLEFESISDLKKFEEELKEKMQGMNFEIVEMKESVNKMIGYAEDKYRKDGLALEANFGSVLSGQSEILVKLEAVCEREDKCSPLMYKALQELSTLELSVESGQIMQKLDMYIEKPNDLAKYFKRVIKSDWPEVKKDKWAQVIQEILEDWKEFKPKKWQQITNILLKSVLGKFVGDELSGYLTSGIINLFEWIKSKTMK